MSNYKFSMLQRERMSNIDTAWLRMEQPTNLMMITGVMIFADKLDIGRLKQILASRFLSHRRFLQRAVRTTSGAYWKTDSHFDIDRHVHRTALPGAADKAELQNLASDLMSTPLDFSKPFVANPCGRGLSRRQCTHYACASLLCRRYRLDLCASGDDRYCCCSVGARYAGAANAGRYFGLYRSACCSRWVRFSGLARD